MKLGFFITGTDTGVGKTVVSAALCHCLVRQKVSVGVMKPVETGVPSLTSPLTDAVRLKAAAGSQDELSLIRPYGFRSPVAPLTAGRLERKPIKLAKILRAFKVLRARHRLLVVEGVGGVHVPLTTSQDGLDLIVTMKMPVVVVGRTGLGGINHARLTIEALRRRKIVVAALVLNRPTVSSTREGALQERSTVSVLRECLNIPVIGPLPHVEKVQRLWHQGVADLANTACVKQLASLIRSSAR